MTVRLRGFATLVPVAVLTARAVAAPHAEADAFRARAIELVNQGDPTGALSAIDRAVAVDPADFELLFVRAGVRVVAAVDAFNRVEPPTVAVAELQRIEQQLLDAMEELRQYISRGQHTDLRKVDVATALVRIQDKVDAVVRARAAAEERVRFAEHRREVERVRAANARTLLAYERVRDRRGSRRTAGWILTGIGLAAGGTAGMFMLLGDRKNDDILDGGFSMAVDIEAAADRGQLYNKLATGIGIGAGALLAVGVPLLVLSGEPERPKLILVPNGTGAKLEVRF